MDIKFPYLRGIPRITIHILRTNIRELRRLDLLPASLVIEDQVSPLRLWMAPKRPFKFTLLQALNHHPAFPKKSVEQIPPWLSLSTSIVLNLLLLWYRKLFWMAEKSPSPKSKSAPTRSVYPVFSSSTRKSVNAGWYFVPVASTISKRITLFVELFVRLCIRSFPNQKLPANEPKPCL